MTIADLNTGAIRLQRSTKNLKEAWQTTKEHWRDQAAEKFEKTYLNPLGNSVNYTVTAIRQMMKVMADAERECSDLQS
ncbi:MAG: hypothetical protein ACI9G1_002894 [Pirellulaceae bacterium]|jgi:hypothetical protein